MKLVVTLAALLAVSPAFALDFFGRPYDHGMQATGTSELGLPPFRESHRRYAESCDAVGIVDQSCGVWTYGSADSRL